MEITGNAYARLMWGDTPDNVGVIPKDKLYSLWEISNSPVEIRVVASNDISPQHTEATGDGLYEGTVNAVSTFEFCPRDKYVLTLTPMLTLSL